MTRFQSLQVDDELKRVYGKNVHRRDVYLGSELMELKERYNASLKVFERLGQKPRREV